MAPQRFGPDLMLLERLAFGGMAEVFRARQSGLGGFDRTVAVKRILPQFAADENFRRMFEQEVKLCSRMQHGNVVQIFGVGAYDSYLYLVMEFIYGQTVATMVKRALQWGRLPPVPVALYIAAEAARGLHHAHTMVDDMGQPLRVVHRDVSPQNIMVTYEGSVKVVDFGVAKAADGAELTATGHVKGKPSYMSPEQIQGKGLDARTDIFALGIVLWEMLTGRRLFKKDNPVATGVEVLQKTIEAPSTYVRAVSPALDEVVLRALSRDIDNRYHAARSFAQDLDSVLRQEFPAFHREDLSGLLKALFAEEISSSQQVQQEMNAVLPTMTPSGRGSSGANLIAGVQQELQVGDPVAPQSPEGTQATFYQTNTVRPLSTPMGTAMIPTATPERSLGWLIAGVVVVLMGLGILWWQNRPVEPHIPSDFPGLIAWYRADTLLGQSDGSRVATWSDNGPFSTSAIQKEPRRQPVFKQASPGLPARVNFDGVDDYLIADPVAAAARRGRGLTAIWLAKVRERKKQYIWSIQSQQQNLDIARAGFNEQGHLRGKATVAVGSGYVDSPLPAEVSVLAVCSMVIDGETLRLYQRGEEIASAPRGLAVAFGQAFHFSIGQEFDDGGPSDFFGGSLVELALFDRALDERQLRSLELEMGRKYDLSVLD